MTCVGGDGTALTIDSRTCRILHQGTQLLLCGAYAALDLSDWRLGSSVTQELVAAVRLSARSILGSSFFILISVLLFIG